MTNFTNAEFICAMQLAMPAHPVYQAEDVYLISKREWARILALLLAGQELHHSAKEWREHGRWHNDEVGWIDKMMKDTEAYEALEREP